MYFYILFSFVLFVTFVIICKKISQKMEKFTQYNYNVCRAGLSIYSAIMLFMLFFVIQ